MEYFLVRHYNFFVLPSQIQQVFDADAECIGPWRVVLHNEPRSKRSQVSYYEKFINTRICIPTLEVEALLHPISNIPNMVGAIKLYERDVDLTIAPLFRDNFRNISDEG